MKRLILTIITLLYVAVSYAQLSNTINRHFIIAVDGAVPNYTDILQSSKVRNAVEEVLCGFKISDKDYVSIVSYQIDLLAPNFETFVWSPEAKSGKKILWRALPSKKLSEFGDWANIVAGQHAQKCGISAYKASFQSAVKPYILKRVQSKGSICVNETYLLMLTDERVNGTDDNYQYEWKNISTVPGAKLKEMEDSVFQTISSINRMFQYESIKVLNQNKVILADGFMNPFVLVGYKINPTSIPAIQSIANIPAQLPVQKIRGGYRIKLYLEPFSDKYSIEQIELTINKNNKTFIGNVSSIEAFIERSQLSEGDTITLRTWVKFKDGIYNGLIMNPYDKQYRDGLTIKQAVVFKDDTKIFGKISMIDALWWWYPNDIQSAVIVWDVLIILVFIVFVCIMAYKIFNTITRYIPSNDKIKINKINGNHN